MGITTIAGNARGRSQARVRLDAHDIFMRNRRGKLISVNSFAYSILFIRQNLLQVNALIYFLPLVSMAITLALVGRKVSFEELPGFDRLSGLVVLIAATFVVILALERTRIWLLFGGSMGTLLVAAALIYSVLKWAASRICGGRNEPNADAGPTAG